MRKFKKKYKFLEKSFFAQEAGKYQLLYTKGILWGRLCGRSFPEARRSSKIVLKT